MMMMMMMMMIEFVVLRVFDVWKKKSKK